MFHYKNIFLPHYHKFPEGQVYALYIFVSQCLMCRECSIKNFRPRCQLFIFIIFIFPFIFYHQFSLSQNVFLIFLSVIFKSKNLSTYCRFWRHYDLFCVNGSQARVHIGITWGVLNVLIFIVSHVNSPYTRYGVLR